MDELTEYLYDPVKHGVIVAKVAIGDPDKILALLRMEKKEKQNEGFKMAGTFSLGPIQLIDGTRSDGILVDGLNAFVDRKDDIKPEYDAKLAEWVYSVIEIGGFWTVSTSTIDEKPSLSPFLEGINPFGPDIVMARVNDVVHVTESITGSLLLMEITSIGYSGVSKYLEMLKLLPLAEQRSVVLDPTDSHSSRYAYEPFVSAAEMWLGKSSTQITLPRYLLDYLNASINYLKKEEWRTSITLSAIAVESILAELYEEEFHEIAPDVPLGALHDSIKKKLGEKSSLLVPVDQYIGRVNNSRIAAVHRGSRQVSQKESIDALRGAIRVAIWYYLIDSNRRYGQPKQ